MYQLSVVEYTLSSLITIITNLFTVYATTANWYTDNQKVHSTTDNWYTDNQKVHSTTENWYTENWEQI